MLLKSRRQARLGSRGNCRLVAQHEQFIAAQFGKRDGPTVRIEKFHFKSVRCMNLDNRTNLTGHKPSVWLVLKDSHDIQQFDRPFLHANFISRNR